MNVEQQASPSDRLMWVKSSYSDSEGAECVEVAWRRSSYSDSDSEGANCVEVAAATLSVHIRDSKDAAGPHLTVSRGSWTDFLHYATAG